MQPQLRPSAKRAQLRDSTSLSTITPEERPAAFEPEADATATVEPADYSKLLLNTKDACAFVKRERGIQLSPSTMASLVVRGGGAPYVKFFGQRYYRASSLLAWIDEQCGEERSSSSEAA